VQHMETWTGITERVDYVKVALPAFVKMPAFQVGIRAASASTRACSLARHNLESDRGAPR
jgi:hypothetical protein